MKNKIWILYVIIFCLSCTNKKKYQEGNNLTLIKILRPTNIPAQDFTVLYTHFQDTLILNKIKKKGVDFVEIGNEKFKGNIVSLKFYDQFVLIYFDNYKTSYIRDENRLNAYMKNNYSNPVLNIYFNNDEKITLKSTPTKKTMYQYLETNIDSCELIIEGKYIW